MGAGDDESGLLHAVATAQSGEDHDQPPFAEATGLDRDRSFRGRYRDSTREHNSQSFIQSVNSLIDSKRLCSL